MVDRDMVVGYWHHLAEKINSLQKKMRRQVQFKYLLTEASQNRGEGQA